MIRGITKASPTREQVSGMGATVCIYSEACGCAHGHRNWGGGGGTGATMQIYSYFRGSIFQNFLGEHAPGPLVTIHLGTGLFSSCEEFYYYSRWFIPREIA